MIKMIPNIEDFQMKFHMVSMVIRKWLDGPSCDECSVVRHNKNVKTILYSI